MSRIRSRFIEIRPWEWEKKKIDRGLNDKYIPLHLGLERPRPGTIEEMWGGGDEMDGKSLDYLD